VSALPALVVASGNRGKLREIRAILADLPVEWRGLDAFPGIRLPEEGDDYTENAVAKARAAAAATGLLAVADDSGLEVAGLAGEPGPRSARYGGPGLDDAARVAHLLAELRGKQGSLRDARFVCAAAWAAPDGEIGTAWGECPGRILPAPRGQNGFGYDPVFFSTELQAGMAELPDDRKHAISHRGRAFRALRASLAARLARAGAVSRKPA
jgi:XTP/dITP diphosphohydrolase